MQRRRQTVDGIHEVDRQHRFDVPSTLGSGSATTSCATEHLAQDVAHRISAKVAGIKTKSATVSAERLRSCSTNLVVFLASTFIAEHVVGSGDLLEALLRRRIVGIGVGMQLASEFAVCLGDVLLRRGWWHAEDCVVVLFKPLALHDQPLTLTIAARNTRPFHLYPVRSTSLTTGAEPSPSSCRTASADAGSNGCPTRSSASRPCLCNAP